MEAAREGAPDVANLREERAIGADTRRRRDLGIIVRPSAVTRPRRWTSRSRSRLTGEGLPRGGYGRRRTMRQVIGTGRLTNVPLGYNPFSSMPSLHVAWALIAALALLFLARHPLLRMLGPLYPGVMVVTVHVTGNHDLLDPIGVAGAVRVAALLT